jgi:hypothetical protein
LAERGSGFRGAARAESLEPLSASPAGAGRRFKLSTNPPMNTPKKVNLAAGRKVHADQFDFVDFIDFVQRFNVFGVEPSVGGQVRDRLIVLINRVVPGVVEHNFLF